MKSLRLLNLPVLLVLCLALGCSNKNATSDNATDNSGGANGGAPGKGQQAHEAQPVVIPAGKAIHVRTGEALSSNSSQAGQEFSGTLAQPVEVAGHAVIASGAPVHGTVVAAKAMGHFKGGALLELRLNSVSIKGKEHPIETKTWSATLKGKGKRSTVAIAGGAGLGAALGGMFGGGKGAAIGAAAGAGAGTAGAAFTGNKEIKIPVESTLVFTLSNSVEVR